MDIGINIFEALFVQKEAPALTEKGNRGGGADIRERYVLGLRFKPAPVFHFLGARFFAKGILRIECRETCLKRAKSERTTGLSGPVVMGGGVW